MSALVATLTSLPYTQFRRNKHFYLWYDSLYVVTIGGLVALMHAAQWHGFTTAWDLRVLAFLPLVCHMQILCSAWIHNATHNNFPRAINRLVGELCGLAVLTRFASWEIIHQRHHKYSDDLELDPHPIVAGSSGYFPYLARTVVGVEKQLQKMYFEMYGDTPEGRRFQKYRAILSFTASFALLPYAWYLLLGAPLFVMLFVPSALVGFFHLIHFNWSTHNPWSKTNDFRPVNLNSGFFRVGNWLWHGIYFHANHHKNASIFNPGRMDPKKALPVILPGGSTDHYPRKKTKTGAKAV